MNDGKLRVLDLFSGIGGFSLGLERAGGFRTVAFCEIEPFCQRVLRKHWPDVPIFGDIRKLCRRIYDCEPENEDGEVLCPRCNYEFSDCECTGTDQFTDEYGFPDVICGGFPCQDISLIGKRAGIYGERSNLWFEFNRIVDELAPRWVIVENVSALIGHGLSNVVGGLHDSGYDAFWYVIPAYSVGAPHRRKRAWIVAHSRSEGLERHTGNGETKGQAQQVGSIAPQDLLRGTNAPEWWKGQPGIRRVVDGVPSYVDRIAALGNAVVPQIPELIGRAIMQAEGMTCL